MNTENESENQESWFVKYIVKPIDKLSSWLKDKTTLNSQDWILATLLILGAYFVLKPFEFQLPIQEKLGIFVLWITFIAIMWYTKETYWLKQVQQKTLNQQRIKDNFDLMPFLDIHISFVADASYYIVNNGKGVAKNVEIKFTYKYKGDEKIFVKYINTMYPSSPIDFDILTDGDLLTDLGSMEDDEFNQIIVEGNYQDFAERPYFFNFQGNTNVDGSFKLIDQGPNGWNIREGFNR